MQRDPSLLRTSEYFAKAGLQSTAPTVDQDACAATQHSADDTQSTVAATPSQEEALLAHIKEVTPIHSSDPLQCGLAFAALAMMVTLVTNVRAVSLLVQQHVAFPTMMIYADGSQQARIVMPEMSVIVETGVVFAFGAAIACTQTALLWTAKCQRDAGELQLARLLSVVAIILGLATLPAPFLVNVQHRIPCMGSALQLWVLFWKVADLVGGTARPAVLLSPSTLLTHLLILVEYRGDAHSNERPAPGELRAVTLQMVGNLAGFVGLATLLMNEPPAALAQSATGASVLDALRMYAHVWVIYFCLCASGDSCAVALLALGYRPQVFFRAPLTTSTSPIDFWSRRWNLLIKGLFHRSIFSPLRSRGVPPALCAMSAFVVSGLFHEYAFMAASHGAACGSNLLFFVSQAVICSLEIASGPLGVRPPRWLLDSSRLRILATTLCLVPFSPLFMAPLRVGSPSTLEEMVGAVPHVAWQTAA